MMKPNLFVLLAVLAFLFSGCVGEEAQKTAGEVGENATENATALFLDLSALSKGVECKVSYEIREGGYPTAPVVVYMRFPLVRADSPSPYEEDVSISFYHLAGNKTYYCTTQYNRSSCVEMPGEEPLTWEEGIESHIDDYSITLLPQRSFAGIQAICFSVTEMETEEEADYCYSAGGVPLYMRGPEYEVEATSVKMGVSESDFILPAEPAEISFPAG